MISIQKMCSLVVVGALSACGAPRENDQTLANQPALAQARELPRTRTLEKQLTVASFNINYANYDLGEVVKLIKMSGADVIALQETTPDSQRYLVAALGGDYPHSEFKDWKRLGGGFGFLSRNRIESIDFLPQRGGFFGTYVGNFVTAAGTVQVANLHLTPVRYWLAKTFSATQREVLRAESIHAQEIEFILENLRDDLPTVVVGDFNSVPSHIAATKLQQNQFVDTYSQLHPNDEQPTWSDTIHGVELAFRVDFIFANSKLAPRSSTSIATHASDHNLLVAQLALLD